MNETLRECPLCASFRIELDYYKVIVYCMNCGCNTGTKETVKEAIEIWNNRKIISD
jgi:uncharacterized protein (DUF983 family)